MYAGETSVSREAEDKTFFKEDFACVKGSFRSSLGKSVAEGIFSDEIALLQQSNIPLLVVFGAEKK